MNLASRFQSLFRRQSLHSIKVEEVSDRLLNLKPRTSGVYIGLRSENMRDLDDARSFLGRINAGFITKLDRGDHRLSVYFVPVKPDILGIHKKRQAQKSLAPSKPCQKSK